METVKSRSESPFSNNKIKGMLTDTSENGETAIEQIKMKKKNLRNKQKAQLNGKENEDIQKNGNDNHQEEMKIDNNDDENLHENGNQDIKESVIQDEINSKEYASEVTLDVSEAVVVNSVTKATDTVENTSNNESTIAVSDENVADYEDTFTVNSNSSKTEETDSSAKKDIIGLENSVSTPEETNTRGYCEEVNDKDIVSSDEFSKDKEHIVVCPSVEEESQNGLNNFNDSNEKNLDSTKEDNDQAYKNNTPKNDNSFSNKITNFLGKWNSSSSDQKQDSEVSSTKKLKDSQNYDDSVLNHPYLSKVTGRPGIRERGNANNMSITSEDEKMKTPKNTGMTLDDSFRVQTDPLRFDRLELHENPTLRKYKGKRCLNASDDQDDNRDMYLEMSKRRKLDDKTAESGFLGSILWSPFRKKSMESEEPLKMTTAESKLSRFLSPFWFWKKTTEK